MPWKCPACRLELVLDKWMQKLTVAPMPAERPHAEPKHK
jgi:hypothetical protein